MATQTRVPGAASSEVDFELERFERTSEDRIEVSGRWYGLRGRRFVRPVLNLNASGARRRAIALLEHKPWAADDGKTWLAAFRWPEGAGDVQGAELEVGPGLVVELPAPGAQANAAVRVSALRPHVPTPPPTAYHTAAEMAEGDEGGASMAPDGERGAALAPDGPRGASAGRDGSPSVLGPDVGHASADVAERRGRRSSSPFEGAPHWTASPPRDLLTAALAERDEAIADRDEAESERVAALNDRDDALSRRDAALRDVERAGAEREEAVAERDRLTAELERVTRERDIVHAERNRTLQDAEAVARERDQAAAERDAARSELSRALPAREEAIRERDAETARADRAESERDTAFAERKSAVAQRDRARRERDRAMRAAGVEPPEESPYVAPAAIRSRQPPETVDEPGDGVADVVDLAQSSDAAEPRSTESAAASSAATPPGSPLPSRPVKRIGATPAGPAPEQKPLLTPVDAGPRRLSRTRRAPSAPARWAVRILVVLLLLATAIVLLMLLTRAV
jgi:hypothetical protein